LFTFIIINIISVTLSSHSAAESSADSRDSQTADVMPVYQMTSINNYHNWKQQH